MDYYILHIFFLLYSLFFINPICIFSSGIIFILLLFSIAHEVFYGYVSFFPANSNLKTCTLPITIDIISQRILLLGLAVYVGHNNSNNSGNKSTETRLKFQSCFLAYVVLSEHISC